MMLSLDSFVFSLATAPFSEMQRQRNWKHRTNSRVGVRDASQFTGIGDDTFTLNGMVAADNKIGSIASIDQLAKMGDAGDAYVLVSGTGAVYGAYIIESLNETATHHTPEGVPRKIEFNLSLKRVPDDGIAATQGDGKATASAAKESLDQIKAVATVGANIYSNVKNLSLNSIKNAALGTAAMFAPDVAESAIKGLSTASGGVLNKAITSAKSISTLNGNAVSSAVTAVLNKTAGQ